MISAELLPWVWAVEDQLSLLGRFDAEAIAAANEARDGNRRRLLSLVSDFRTVYALKRGQVGIFLQRRAQRFINVCTKHFSQQLTDFGQAQKRWSEVVAELQSGDSAAQKFWSPTSKIFWFFHPDLLPMYDYFTLQGLRRVQREHRKVRKLRPAITADNFLDEFDDFLRRSQPLIDQALCAVGRAYPYRPRIAEKFLWIKGQPNGSKILERFGCGLKMAPYRIHRASPGKRLAV